MNLRALLGALFFINLNVSHTSMQTPATSSSTELVQGEVEGKCGPVSRVDVISVMVSCCDTQSLAHWLLWSDSISASVAVDCSAIS